MKIRWWPLIVMLILAVNPGCGNRKEASSVSEATFMQDEGKAVVSERETAENGAVDNLKNEQSRRGSRYSENIGRQQNRS